MITIYYDPSLKGVSYSSDRVFDDDNLAVDSGFSSAGEVPVIAFYFKRPDITIIAGSAQKAGWGTAQNKKAFAFSILMSQLHGDHLLQILAEATERGRKIGVAAVKDAVVEVFGKV